MALRKFFAIAFRNLVRNGRRTTLTAFAVSLGLMVVLAMSGMIAGMVESFVDDSIRVATGHFQIQSASAEDGKQSLLSEDLIADGVGVAAQIEALPQTKSASGILNFGGLLITSEESAGIGIMSINPDDPFHDPIRNGIVEGEYLNADDRRTVLVGKLLADQMGIQVGQRVSIAATNADGVPQEGIFTVAGLVDTGFPSLDINRIIIPLEQGQSFAGVGNRVSTIVVLLNDIDDTAAVVSMLEGDSVKFITWEESNALILESVESGLIFYYIMYGIVFIAVAVIIANTLLMSVFARAREIGILGSIGMNRRQILLIFQIEAILLGSFGVVLGLILGSGAVAYLKYVGFALPAETASLVDGMAIGTSIHGDFAPGEFAVLSLALLVVVSLVSLYPAWYAARLEPVDVLQSV